MKRLIQLFLFFLLFLISVIFYNIYFIEKTPNINLKKNIKEEPLVSEIENKNNLIKNLKYDVRLEDNSQYIITSDLSELVYDVGVELVSMNAVVARFISADGTILTITSDKALFNNNIYNTEFRDNVKIVYLDHVIFSEKLDLNFTKNIVVIFDNVIYQGMQGNILTDNIKINLIDKNVEIFMNDPKNKVIVNKN